MFTYWSSGRQERGGISFALKGRSLALGPLCVHLMDRPFLVYIYIYIKQKRWLMRALGRGEDPLPEPIGQRWPI